MKTTEQDVKGRCIRRFKAILNQSHIGRDEELAMLAGYGVESCKDMEAAQLLELCNALDNREKPVDELDKARKRLIASVGAYLRAMGKQDGMPYINGIISRASEGRDINSLTMEKIRSLYNAFNKARKDLSDVREMTEEMIIISQILN